MIDPRAAAAFNHRLEITLQIIVSAYGILIRTKHYIWAVAISAD